MEKAASDQLDRNGARFERDADTVGHGSIQCLPLHTRGVIRQIVDRHRNPRGDLMQPLLIHQTKRTGEQIQGLKASGVHEGGPSTR